MKVGAKHIGIMAAVTAGIYCLAVFSAVHLYNTARLQAADHLVIGGGGFIFNYRISEIKAGITVAVVKELPSGSSLVAEFETPGDGILTLRSRAEPGKRGYAFETDPLINVEAEKSYRVVVRLLAERTGEQLEQHETFLKSGIAPRAMPEEPLTIGPGYHPNPGIQRLPTAEPATFKE